MLAFKSFNRISNLSKKFYKDAVFRGNQIITIQSFNRNQKFYNSTDTAVKSSEKFWDLLARRRKQAKCSIIVQVHSPQSCTELFTYCSKFGNITEMKHYTPGSDQTHFIIVEFENETSVSNVLSSSHHAVNGETMSVPVCSQFLWFRATGKQKRKKLQIPETSSPELPIPFTQFGTRITSKETINSALTNCNTISDQMIHLQHMVALSETGSRLRYLACRQIELALSGMFPACKAIPFGSSVNNFGKEGCDLDIVVRLNPSAGYDSSRLAFHSKALVSSERSQTQRHMECLADIVHLFLPGCINVRRILQARVPIIKYNQEQTNLECDLSMTNMTAVYMSDLLYTLSTIDNRVRPLIFTIRRWAYQMGLTNNSPGRWITNFSLTLMVLFFLQKVNILPAVNSLMSLAEAKDKYITEDGVNCSILHDLTKLPSPKLLNEDALNSLLLQFFEYYSKFDFTNQAISLNDAKEVHKPDTGALYIVNPLERHFNVSKNVSVEELERLRVEFRNAAWVLESQDTPKDKTNWGLLDLFKSSLQKPIPMSIKMPNRLVEIKGLFQDDSENGKEKTVFKNLGLEKEIEKIKLDTAEKVRSVSNSSKVRIRRR